MLFKAKNQRDPVEEELKRRREEKLQQELDEFERRKPYYSLDSESIEAICNLLLRRLATLIGTGLDAKGERR